MGFDGARARRRALTTGGPRLPRSARVTAASDVVSARVAGGFALLHLGNGVYHGLQGVGARVWEMVSEGSRVGDIEESLLREYDVDPDLLARDLEALLGGLLERRLVEMTPGTPPSRETPE